MSDGDVKDLRMIFAGLTINTVDVILIMFTLQIRGQITLHTWNDENKLYVIYIYNIVPLGLFILYV